VRRVAVTYSTATPTASVVTTSKISITSSKN
jgi:hypothetical protein